MTVGYPDLLLTQPAGMARTGLSHERLCRTFRTVPSPRHQHRCVGTVGTAPRRGRGHTHPTRGTPAFGARGAQAQPATGPRPLRSRNVGQNHLPPKVTATPGRQRYRIMAGYPVHRRGSASDHTGSGPTSGCATRTRYPVHRVRRSDGGRDQQLREGNTTTVQAAADAFLSPPGWSAVALRRAPHACLPGAQATFAKQPQLASVEPHLPQWINSQRTLARRRCSHCR